MIFCSTDQSWNLTTIKNSLALFQDPLSVCSWTAVQLHVHSCCRDFSSAPTTAVPAICRFCGSCNRFHTLCVHCAHAGCFQGATAGTGQRRPGAVHPSRFSACLRLQVTCKGACIPITCSQPGNRMLPCCLRIALGAGSVFVALHHQARRICQICVQRIHRLVLRGSHLPSVPHPILCKPDAPQHIRPRPSGPCPGTLAGRHGNLACASDSYSCHGHHPL
jgi:hypothetical protein